MPCKLGAQERSDIASINEMRQWTHTDVVTMDRDQQDRRNARDRGEETGEGTMTTTIQPAGPWAQFRRGQCEVRGQGFVRNVLRIGQ